MGLTFLASLGLAISPKTGLENLHGPILIRTHFEPKDITKPYIKTLGSLYLIVKNVLNYKRRPKTSNLALKYCGQVDLNLIKKLVKFLFEKLPKRAILMTYSPHLWRRVYFTFSSSGLQILLACFSRCPHQVSYLPHFLKAPKKKAEKAFS